MKRNRGLETPAACAEAVAWCLDVPFDEAIRRERELFTRLRGRQSVKSAASRVLSRNAAATRSPVSRPEGARKINSVAIIGAGTMGQWKRWST
jgi:3-hydroxyacyl-CoA dehydrogenase